MNKRVLTWFVPIAASALLLVGGGYAMFHASVAEVDVDQKQPMDADYDHTDKKPTTQGFANDILASKCIANAPQPPIVMIAGIQNRTQKFEDMKNFTDQMRTCLLQSGKVRFINEVRRDDLLREQGYQAASATPETQTRVGRQLGAKYMIGGSFTEVNRSLQKPARNAKQAINRYRLAFNITDLETGELIWMKEQEFARQASQPLIGW